MHQSLRHFGLNRDVLYKSNADVRVKHCVYLQYYPFRRKMTSASTRCPEGKGKILEFEE